MCDLTSTYIIGNLVGKTNLFRLYWAQNKQDSKSYMARVYNLQNSATLEEDVHAQIEKQVIINEIKALRTIDHPNVTKLKEVHEFQGRVVMIFEFIGGSSLLKHIVSQGCLPEVEIIYIMKTLLLTLQVLQKKKILHRNLKPENILFDYTPSGLQLKLKSFGFSCTLDPHEQTTWNVANNICTKCGTPGYMAPELLSHKQSTLAGDIFSMGVILYTCLTGEPMFKGRTSEDIVSKNLAVDFDRTSYKWLRLSENARDLILKMVSESPTKRPTIDMILRHPFFSPTHELTPIPVRQTFLNVEEPSLRTKRNSIEESLFNQDPNYLSVDKALQSLIVSPTYFNLSSSDVPEVPEFYIDSLQSSEDTDKPEEIILKGARLNLPKLGIKIEVVRGSLAQLDPGEKTPTFKIKSFIGTLMYMTGEGHTNEDEYSSDEIDESSPVRNYKKFHTFPNSHPAPLMTQKPIVQKFNTLSFKGESTFDSGTLMTGRKLPELHGPVRKKLATKPSFIEDTIE